MTMFTISGLKIFFLTRHVSLVEACRQITERARGEGHRQKRATRCASWASTRPHLAVAALNPHGGEDGLFGREEIEAIKPAIAAARAQGLQVSGPVPADSVFHMARIGRYDAVLSLYHDQGHIAAKMMDFEKTVQRDAGAADPAHQRGSRHGVRYRGHRQGERGQHDRGDQGGGGIRGARGEAGGDGGGGGVGGLRRGTDGQSMKVFWSWQSDSPGKTGRHFVRSALAAAIQELRQVTDLEEPSEREVRESLHLDHDRQGVPGSPDLAATILRKIERAAVFVADVTLIPMRSGDEARGERSTPRIHQF